MKKLALMLAAATVFSTPVMAADTLIVNEGDKSVISGTVKDVRFEALIVHVLDKDITVDVDNLDIEDLDSYFPVGSSVRIVGELEGSDQMDAKEVMRLDEPKVEINAEMPDSN